MPARVSVQAGAQILFWHFSPYILIIDSTNFFSYVNPGAPSIHVPTVLRECIIVEWSRIPWMIPISFNVILVYSFKQYAVICLRVTWGVVLFLVAIYKWGGTPVISSIVSSIDSSDCLFCLVNKRVDGITTHFADCDGVELASFISLSFSIDFLCYFVVTNSLCSETHYILDGLHILLNYN